MNAKTLWIGAGLVAVATAVIGMQASATGRTVWRYLVNPSPLSQPHEFLEARCGACHTPGKGVEASNCIVCHANDEVLLQREPTAFHGDIKSCKECHAEHLGRIKRPIIMDHAALARIGLREVARSGGDVPSRSEGLVGYLIGSRASSSESRLDCVVCHAMEDPHNLNSE